MQCGREDDLLKHRLLKSNLGVKANQSYNSKVGIIWLHLWHASIGSKNYDWSWCYGSTNQNVAFFLSKCHVAPLPHYFTFSMR